MPYKYDPSEVKVVLLKFTGDDSSPHPPWVCLKKNGDDTAKATSDWKGLRVTVMVIDHSGQTQMR